MTRVARLAAAALLAAPPAAASEEPSAAAAVPGWYCLSSAMHMIRMGEDALDGDPAAEQAMRRRGLLHEWRQRLAAGEPPCEVYREIFEAVGDDF